MKAFDPRIVRVGLEIDDQIITFEGLRIEARGTKFRSALQSTCECRIYNLTQDQRQFILTRASPIARSPQLLTPINLTLDVGRESNGTFRLFEGPVFQGGVSQPPDIGILLYSLNNNFLRSNTIQASESSIATLQTIANNIAKQNGLTLEFKATNKQIENYSFTGTPANQIEDLNQMGDIVAYIDNKTLVVQDADKARGETIRVINSGNGMVGQPTPTAYGCTVTMMLDNTIQVGCEVEVQSTINPACNGNYIVQKVEFDIANRDKPFWYILDCKTKDFYTGQQ